MADTDVFRELYRIQGWVLIPGLLSQSMRRALINYVEAGLDRAVAGSEDSTTWREVGLDHPSPTFGTMPIADVEIICGGAVGRWAQWANVYGPGSSIEPHRDAAGDSHFLLCLSQPPEWPHGRLWLNSPESTVPMSVGDGILFVAREIPHGTHPVPLGEATGRITLNSRIWIE